MPIFCSMHRPSATDVARGTVHLTKRLLIGIWHGLSKAELSTDYMQATGKHDYGPK